MVVVASWFTHLARDWHDECGQFHRRLAQRFRVIRYDLPGMGLSDRHHWDFSLDAQVDALARVVDAAGERRVALLACGPGTAAAISYAVRFPSRVTRMIVVGGAPRVIADDGYPDGMERRRLEALAELAGADWPLAAQTLAFLLGRGAEHEAVDRFGSAIQAATSGRVAVDYLRCLMAIDVRDLVARLTVPTLVVHYRDDHVISVNNAYRLAEAIKGSELRLLEGAAHLPWYGAALEVIRLVGDVAGRRTVPLTDRELEIMEAVAAGMSNQDIADHLGISVHTVARHLANVYVKLDVTNRMAAVAELRALQAGAASSSPNGGVFPRSNGVGVELLGRSAATS